MWYLTVLFVAIAIFFLWKLLSGNSSTDTSISSSAGSTNSTGSTGSAGSIKESEYGTDRVTVNRSDSVAGPAGSVNTGDVRKDIQEMIKILNLAAPDAGRLGISSETLLALRSGATNFAYNRQELSSVADKLSHMLR